MKSLSVIVVLSEAPDINTSTVVVSGVVSAHPVIALASSRICLRISVLIGSVIPSNAWKKLHLLSGICIGASDGGT